VGRGVTGDRAAGAGTLGVAAPAGAGAGEPEGTSGDVRSRRRAQTQAEILDAAWRLAARDGIAGLSLRDLAGKVGMRAPSLYTYFPHKAAIYDAMFATGYRELDATLDAVELDVDDPVGSLEANLSAFLGFCCASVPRYQLLFTRAIPDWEPSPDAYAVSATSFAGMSERLAQLGIDDPRQVDLLTALTAGLAAQQLANEPDGTRWRQLSRDAATMFWAHVRGR
jgi:AcrR family transcriptional regulator